MYDAVVIGGGAAGLAGAVSLLRSRRSVLVVDAGEQRNLPADAAHNFLTREGTPPSELYALGAAEVRAYGGTITEGAVTAISPWTAKDGNGIGFDVQVATQGEKSQVTVSARRILLAAGLVDNVPDVPGVRERWGRDVLHCPYCHGYEARDQKIVVWAQNTMVTHQALMWRQLSNDVTVVIDPDAVPLPQGVDAERLAIRQVPIVEGRVAQVEATDDRLSGLVLTTGEHLPADVVVCAPEVDARADLLEKLGVQRKELRMGDVRFGSVIDTDPRGSTSIPGIFAAGNVVEATAQVIAAAAAGNFAGAQMNADLITEDADAAIRAARDADFERPAWEVRYGQPEQMWSGSVNAVLKTEAAKLTPGRALDIGSGEGADVLWLAENGWHATGFEFSSTGRARAAKEAAERGLGDRVEWRDVDVRQFEADGEHWDLVTSHFVHLPDSGMVDVVRRLSEAVAPNGTLLVVGHHPMDMPPQKAIYTHTAQDLAPALDPAEWEITTEARARRGRAHDNGETTWHDAVLIARRK